MYKTYKSHNVIKQKASGIIQQYNKYDDDMF